MLMIADLYISVPFRVFDVASGNYILSFLDRSVPGDIPPDIASLPVHGLRAVDGVLYIDVMTGVI